MLYYSYKQENKKNVYEGEQIMKTNLLFEVTIKTEYYASINQIIERETGYADWFISQKDLNNQIKEGFVVIDGKQLSVYWW